MILKTKSLISDCTKINVRYANLYNIFKRLKDNLRLIKININRA